MTDARFEEGAEGPLLLRAETPADLSILSTLLQDAVGQVEDTAWMPKRRRFALLLTRFRWEDKNAAERSGRGYERVRALLTIENVLAVQASGLDPKARDLVFSLLAIELDPDAALAISKQADGTGAPTAGPGPTGPSDGPSGQADAAELEVEPSPDPSVSASAGPGGKLRLVLAGDGEILLEIESLEAVLRDVTRPHLARARRAPDHAGPCET
ncbi:MAG: DUF2948 family protein [Pseudomonadota bacterium]